jgi:hypothetical protein
VSSDSIVKGIIDDIINTAVIRYPRMYTLSPSKSIKGSNYGEFLRQKCIVMYTTVQVRSEFGKFGDQYYK